MIFVPAIAAGLVLGQQAWASAASPQLGCGQRGETSAPIVFNDPRDTGRATMARVGPIELHGGRAYASPRVFSRLRRQNGYVAAKVALVVQAGRSVQLKVSGASPASVLLAYGPRRAAQALRIDSCAATVPARTRHGVVGSGTLFTGVFELTAAQCVNVEVTDRVTRRTWRARLPFGRACSP